MKKENPPIDTRTVFAAVALHKLVAGMGDPEEHFYQIENAFTEVCEQAWRISDRMMEVRGLAGIDGNAVMRDAKEVSSNVAVDTASP